MTYLPFLNKTKYCEDKEKPEDFIPLMYMWLLGFYHTTDTMLDNPGYSSKWGRQWPCVHGTYNLMRKTDVKQWEIAKREKSRSLKAIIMDFRDFTSSFTISTMPTQSVQ